MASLFAAQLNPGPSRTRRSPGRGGASMGREHPGACGSRPAVSRRCARTGTSVGRRRRLARCRGCRGAASIFLRDTRHGHGRILAAALEGCQPTRVARCCGRASSRAIGVRRRGSAGRPPRLAMHRVAMSDEEAAQPTPHGPPSGSAPGHLAKEVPVGCQPELAGIPGNSGAPGAEHPGSGPGT